MERNDRGLHPALGGRYVIIITCMLGWEVLNNIYFNYILFCILGLYCLLQMILLKTKHEEDKGRLENRLRKDMEAQREQLTNMMKANIQELRTEKEVVVDQNKTLKSSIAGMQRSLNELNSQIECLQKRI